MRVGIAGPVEELAAMCPGSFIPEWSPTGQWIAFFDADRQTILASPDGKTTRSLAARA